MLTVTGEKGSKSNPSVGFLKFKEVVTVLGASKLKGLGYPIAQMTIC